MPRTIMAAFLVSIATLDLQFTRSYAQIYMDGDFSTGEIELVRKRYVGPDEKVAGQARFLHGLEQLQEIVPGDRLMGNGVIVAVWDEGLIQANHQDLTPRVIFKDPVNAKLHLSNHATHVAGTIAGTGRGRRAAHGMAPGATLWSYDFRDDVSEMRALATGKARVAVSNHSYAFRGGWTKVCVEPAKAGVGNRLVWVWAGAEDDQEDRRFGQYGEHSVEFDRIAHSAPEWTMVVSAGNTRSPLLDPRNAAKTVPTMQQFSELAGKYDFAFNGEHRLVDCWGKPSAKPHRSNRHEGGGYDSIPPGPAAAKNVITVGAMADPPFDEIFDPASGRFRPLERRHVTTTDFSSWGPVDDGRIKPDVVASGDALLATAIPERCATMPCQPGDVTGPGDASNYVQMSGTSMAGPVVSGTMALLNELSRRRRGGRNLRSDEAKALLIHTALAPAGVEGPTYRVGWGAIQADLAGRLLISEGRDQSLRMIDVRAGAPTVLRLRRAGLHSPRATLVWLDEAGGKQTELNERTPVLVNDLDMTLTSPSGKAIRPWTLDPVRPSAPAGRGVNSRDNVERIDVPSSDAGEEGEWVLQIVGRNWPKATEVKAALAIWGFALVKDGSSK